MYLSSFHNLQNIYIPRKKTVKIIENEKKSKHERNLSTKRNLKVPSIYIFESNLNVVTNNFIEQDIQLFCTEHTKCSIQHTPNLKLYEKPLIITKTSFTTDFMKKLKKLIT